MSTSQVTHTEGTFHAPDGTALFEQTWQPAQSPTASMILVHGYAEHSGRYAHVGDYFATHGIRICALDLRGHGQSAGRRAFVHTFNDYLLDLGYFMTHVRNTIGDEPLFLFGHSMGGLVVALYTATQQPDIAGLLTSGTGSQVSDDISPFLRQVSQVLSAITPRLPTIPFPLDTKMVSRDPAVVAAYERDPLNYGGRIQARMGAEMNNAVARTHQAADAITVPLLVMNGAADAVVPSSGSERFYARASSADKTLKLYEGLYHEILNEPEQEAVMADMVAWIGGRLGAVRGVMAFAPRSRKPLEHEARG